MGQCTDSGPWIVPEGPTEGLWFNDSEERNDRAHKTMSDPDWLEIVGHPTIPNTQSLRAPPAQMALQPSKERLTAITNKTVSRRYVQKLQKERERNKEVLAEYRDNLPIVIKPMVYPEKPPTWNQKPWHLGSSASLPSREKKFRISKQHGEDFWQESTEAWTKSESGQSDSSQQKPAKAESEKGFGVTQLPPKKPWSYCSSSSEPMVLDHEYVPPPGFQGANGLQSSNFKYKFYKKPNHLSTETASSHVQSTFKPKGYGSLYDEMEFERKYKKVFDLNKHIHFVHSNFLSGQRIVKRTKLPPIGLAPNLPPNSEKGGDIFAIMSVQKYNHPEDGVGSPRVPDATPRSRGFQSPNVANMRRRRFTEVPKNADIASGFVPATITSPQHSNLSSEDIHELDMAKVAKEPNFRLPSLKMEVDSALGTLTEENTVCDVSSKNSIETVPKSKVKAATDLSMNDVNGEVRARLSKLDDDNMSRDTRSELGDDFAPFNISVHVNIKPKGGDDDKPLEHENTEYSDYSDVDAAPHDHHFAQYNSSPVNSAHGSGVLNGYKSRGNGSSVLKQKPFGLVTQSAKHSNKRYTHNVPLQEEDEQYDTYNGHGGTVPEENFTSNSAAERSDLSNPGHHVIS